MEQHDTSASSPTSQSKAGHEKPPLIREGDRYFPCLSERHLSWKTRVGADLALLPEIDQEAISCCTVLLRQRGDTGKVNTLYRNGGYSFRGLRPWQVPTAFRFWLKVQIVEDTFSCWEWFGSVFPVSGYGSFDSQPAHSYIAKNILKVKQTSAMVIDHVCRNRRCVRPSHLRFVSQRENTLAGEAPSAKKARQTHCIYGHPLSGVNLYVTPSGKRHCRICIARRNREFKIRRIQRA